MMDSVERAAEHAREQGENIDAHAHILQETAILQT
jgi:hypothetical protein